MHEFTRRARQLLRETSPLEQVGHDWRTCQASVCIETRRIVLARGEAHREPSRRDRAAGDG